MREQNELFKHCGVFCISQRAIKDNPEAVQLILSNVLVVKAESEFMTNCIKYWGYSRYFDVMDKSIEPAEYLWIMHKDDQGNTTIEKCEKKGGTVK